MKRLTVSEITLITMITIGVGTSLISNADEAPSDAYSEITICESANINNDNK